MATAAPTHLMTMTGIVKLFPGVRALDGVDLDVQAGEVHCLLGQNGAGKSTLIKVLSGAHQPDEGTIHWIGQPVKLPTPMAAIRLGIATIYQELDLVNDLTVAENITLGHEPSRLGFAERRTERTSAVALLKRLGHPEISPTSVVGTLPAAGKQIVSMARALSRDVKLMIMDEPSAVLDQGEVARLFEVIRDLTANGVAVIYISHRLEEIRAIGDRVTVLKDGRTVATGLPAKTTPTADVIRLMTGRNIEYVFPPRSGQAFTGEPLLDVAGISRAREFEDISFSVHPGEVVGLAGLVGSGRSEILETVYGARRYDSGSVSVGGKALHAGSVPASVGAGVGLCPEERKGQALLLDQSVVSNVTLASLRRFALGPFLRRRKETQAATREIETLDVRPADPQRDARTLSGGNQQKVVLARWLLKGCRVLLLDEPTRGVDVGARSELYALIRELASSGVAVLLVSSEVPEVIGLSDRVLVLRDGRIVHDGPAEEIDESEVLGLVMEGSPR
ncbi:MAG: sugar ABC transporter ATP-binding protein [Actinomycetota bacterium]|nr:sugar ABC transporter ATP-binding protein [Actinomycetota bacterium]